jgi:Transposase DDE domain group 1
MRTLAMPKTAEPWSLTSLREKLIKIGANVVSRGRYLTFQIAEVAVPRQMFADILSLIARLRAPPTPAWERRRQGRQRQREGHGLMRAKQRASPFWCRQPPASIAIYPGYARFTVAQASQRGDSGFQNRWASGECQLQPLRE